MPTSDLKWDDFFFYYYDPPAELRPVVRFKRLTPSAILPVRATAEAACLDLYADSDAHISEAHPTAVVGTGIAIELPPGYVGLVCSRSGLAAKQKVFVLNAPGVIDADYRGEIKVILGRLPVNAAWPTWEGFTIKAGDRIAQLMVLPLPAFHVAEEDNLTSTARGAGGLGSTGI